MSSINQSSDARTSWRSSKGNFVGGGCKTKELRHKCRPRRSAVCMIETKVTQAVPLFFYQYGLSSLLFGIYGKNRAGCTLSLCVSLSLYFRIGRLLIDKSASIPVFSATKRIGVIRKKSFLRFAVKR